MAPIAEDQHVLGRKHEGAVYARLADRDNVVDVRRWVAAELAMVAPLSTDATDDLLIALEVGDGHGSAALRGVMGIALFDRSCYRLFGD